MTRADVTILCLGDSQEALLIRSLAESLHLKVDLTFIGQPNHLFEEISSPQKLAKLVILSAHGTKNGLVFGEFGSQVDTSLLVNGDLPLRIFFERSKLEERIVLSTACDAFSSDPKNVQTYIGHQGYPDAQTVPLFIHKFLYNWKIANLPVLESVKDAKLICPDAALYKGISC